MRNLKATKLRIFSLPGRHLIERKLAAFVVDPSLSASDLRHKYIGEYNSWRNGKSRARENWMPEFQSFRDFLQHMGPKPTAAHTLDRIDFDDPRYGPDLCRWADKKEQAANRSTTHTVHLPSLEMMAAPNLARTIQLSPAAFRTRLRRQGGMSFGSDPRLHKPWPTNSDGRRQAEWERRYMSGPVRRMTRYEYLIRELDKECRRFYGCDRIDRDSASPEQVVIANRLRLCRIWLNKARAEMPKWNRAVSIHENIKFEKSILRDSGFLNRSDVID